MSTPTAPSVGDIVLYGSRQRAALVVEIIDGSLVRLVVFDPSGSTDAHPAGQADVPTEGAYVLRP